MKHKSILSLFIFLLGLGVTTTSCEDMLTPDMDRYNEGFSGTDTVYFYLGIVRNVQDMVEQNELLGDLRSDLVTTTSYSSDSIADIINYKRQADGDNALLNRAAYYKVINQCNFYLSKVDTNAVKTNIYYMRREYAQVVAIRAWTYLQLVQTYGKVPFITKPVDNANTGWEKNPEAWATADNLVDLLKDELGKAMVFEHTLGAPQYGNFNSGNPAFSVSSNYLRFYTDLVMGDLYLLRGDKAKGDYVEAAKNYYYFLKEYAKKDIGIGHSSSASFHERTNSGSGVKSYLPSIASWVGNGLDAASLSNRENITLIPSAANSSFGKVLINTAQIYGYDSHSTNSTDTSDDGETTTTSGSISVKRNYRSRQVAPSEAYLTMNKSQIYSSPVYGGSTNEDVVDIKYYDNAGDARLHATAPKFQTMDNGVVRFVAKCAPISSVDAEGESHSNSAFKYYKSLYRLKQVYLRYAEAINRAGYPRMAFAVLRNGLDFDKMPTVADSIKYDDVNQTAQTVYYLDSAKVKNAINYVGLDELRRAQAEPLYEQFIAFDKNMWKNDGIHEQGCGESVDLDSLYSYEKIVGQRILDEAVRTNTWTKELQEKMDTFMNGLTPDEVLVAAEGEEEGETEEPDRSDYTEIDAADPLEADPLQIQAVETLIADECALEMAYEGTRMFDLIRFARHMDSDADFSNNYGTQWLAWKIARRNEKVNSIYDNPTVFDNALYNMLLTPDNWYIANPVY